MDQDTSLYLSKRPVLSLGLGMFVPGLILLTATPVTQAGHRAAAKNSLSRSLGERHLRLLLESHFSHFVEDPHPWHRATLEGSDTAAQLHPCPKAI